MNRKFEIVFESDEFVVVNKAAGLLSIPDRTQSEESLKEILRKNRPEIYTVHRLDRGTSGLILFAKNPSMHQLLSLAFEERMVEKIYLGITGGILAEKKAKIDAPIAEHPSKNGKMIVHRKGKPSLTEYEVMEEFGGYSLLQFRIHTGRTHQIRVHMQSIGHPLLCDELYGDRRPVYISSLKKGFKLSRSEEEERPILSRLALHASRLAFSAGAENHFQFEAPLPRDLKALTQQLRKWKK